MEGAEGVGRGVEGAGSPQRPSSVSHAPRSNSRGVSVGLWTDTELTHLGGNVAIPRRMGDGHLCGLCATPCGLPRYIQSLSKPTELFAPAPSTSPPSLKARLDILVGESARGEGRGAAKPFHGPKIWRASGARPQAKKELPHLVCIAMEMTSHVDAHAWALDASSYQLWLMRLPRCIQAMSSSSRGMPPVVDYYGLLGISVAADESDINTAYRRHALDCHPDKIPSSDSDEVRSAKIKRFRALGDAKSVLLDPERRTMYDKHRNQAPPAPHNTDAFGEPSMSLTEAYEVWAAAVINAFKRANSDNGGIAGVKLVGSLGIPALMIAMGGAEHGGRLCMTFALLLARDSLDDELTHMSDGDLRIFRQAVMVLAERF